MVIVKPKVKYTFDDLLRKDVRYRRLYSLYQELGLSKSKALTKVVGLQKDRDELLKAGKGYINKDKQYNQLFNLYRKKLRLSEDEALVKVAQIVEAGATIQALGQLRTEKPLNPVTSANSYVPGEPLPDWIKKLSKSLRKKYMHRPMI